MSDSEKPKSSWRERRQSIKNKWFVPFVYFEWKCEQISEILNRWAFLDILGQVARLTILIAVIFYFMEAEDRRKARHYQAWQVINAAQGKPGSGGRIDALQDLHRDWISLAGVDISKAHLPWLNLDYADLRRANLAEANLMFAKLARAVLTDANLAGAVLLRANLTEAHLHDANLAGANLSEANLAGAHLDDANLAGANLSDANLAGAGIHDANLAGAILHDSYLAEAKLFRANLAGADLLRANLAEAILNDANLAGARLGHANLAEADLANANLTGANLWDAKLAGAQLTKANLKDTKNWQKIKSIESANIYDVKNPPDGFIEWAREHGAVLIKDNEEWEKFLLEKRREKSKKGRIKPFDTFGFAQDGGRD